MATPNINNNNIQNGLQVFKYKPKADDPAQPKKIYDRKTDPDPKQNLGKDDFLKLFIAQIEQQDPTAPMTSEKMLQQTSQLASLESSENINKSLKNLTKSLSLGQSFAALNAIGKLGEVSDSLLNHKSGKSDKIDLFLKVNASSGEIKIKSPAGKIVKTIPFTNKKKGINSFYWKGDTNDNKLAPDSNYMVDVSYKDYDGGNHTTTIGKYPIESIKFANNDTLLKMGSRYVPYKELKAITNE